MQCCGLQGGCPGGPEPELRRNLEVVGQGRREEEEEAEAAEH